jgi:hypothetical protein
MTFLVYIEYHNFSRIHIEKILLQMLIPFQENMLTAVKDILQSYSYHFKDTRVINDILNVFIHSHDAWFVKCRKVTCLDRPNFIKRTIIKIIQKNQSLITRVSLKW